MANEWTLNTSPSPLKKGMLIRRPGLDEALEVVKVTGTDFKIKLPGNKTATLPLGAEVEWSWPESKSGEGIESEPHKALDAFVVEPEPEELTSDDASEWLTDWSLLDVGSKIEVLGEPGDFTILRLTDSSARIKHNATGQIQPMSIGHKFRVIDSGEGDAKSKASKGDKSAKATKAEKSPKSRKPRTDKGTKVAEPDDTEDEATTLFDNEPSDEVLTAIENGDDQETDEDADNDLGIISDIFDDDDNEDGDASDDRDLDLDLDSDTDNDSNNEPEDDEMPMPTPAINTKSTKPARSASTSLLTVGQISERTGISYPTLMRYIRDHADRLPSEGEGRSRRFLPEAIEVFKSIRAETKGGRPGKGLISGSGSKSANPRKPRPAPAPAPNRATRTERSHETAAPYAAPSPRRTAQASSNSVSVGVWVPSSGQTIDQILTAAIDHARAQIDGLQSLIDNLEAQRESLKLWS